jgi:glucose/arabinose dehydrogenase
MAWLATRGLRRAFACALLSAMLVVSPFSLGHTPAPAAAAQPAVSCQKGFLGRAAPTVGSSCAAAAEPVGPVAASLPAGFQESVVFSGLTNPTVVRFAADGRVFVGEKSGTIKVFSNLSDTSADAFTGLTTNVHNYWDRGLLGMALDPSLTGGTGSGSYVYVLYTYDHILGTGGGAGQWGDGCTTPPGPTTDGCVVSARLSRLPVSGTIVSGPEQVLIEDWCQQFPSHSIGSLVFGADGSLYVSGGDGANFNAVDYGQWGGTTSPVITPKNPCGDPPNDAMTPPTAEGGALRSQDLRTTGGGSASYASAIAADSPIGYWRLGETSGTFADQTGGAAGTGFGTLTRHVSGALSASNDDGAVLTDGATGYIDIPDRDAYSISSTGVLTVEFWNKPTSSASSVVVSKTGSSGNYEWAVVWDGVGYFVSVWRLDGSSIASGSFGGNVALNAWHHVVAELNSTSQRLRVWIDGAGPDDDIDPWVNVPQNGPGDVNIGRRGDGISYHPGSTDELAIYNHVLTAGQVAAHRAAATGSGGTGDPTGLDGAVLRVDPATGAGRPGNPFFSSSDANARRIIAYGLRNPFRITTRPGTNELWVGDVGWNTWEEINRIPDATDGVAENFGWPCYEGVGRQSGYDGANLNICETLYGEGTAAVAAPIYTYNHSANIVSGESCSVGSSSVSGLAFYPEATGNYPAAYRGGLFFTDHSRNCIWFMPKGANGQPDPNARQVFVSPAINPVDLEIGPGSDLFYVDFDAGTIRRITFSSGNQPPTAVIQAVPTSGAAPLTVQFNGSGSSDPEGTPLTYAWDLDGDGLYDDATGVSTQWTYQNPGTVTTGLLVTDGGGATGTASQVITVGNTPPVPVITAPTSSTKWKVGDTINFSGSASDGQDGNLPASALTWTLVLQHCPSNCHTHDQGTWPGVASGSFVAPDHEYPSYLELTLTARDSAGATGSTTVRLDPSTVNLTFQTVPTGLSLAVNSAASAAPFTRTVIVNSMNSVTATSPQTLNGLTYAFASWSDGLAQSHTIVAPATNATYTATYATSSFSVAPIADAYIRWNKTTQNFGSATSLLVRSGQYRTYLKFTVSGLSGPAQNARLRLWVTGASTSAGSVYALTNTSWTETGITWANAPPITGTALAVGGAATAGTWLELNLGTAITGNGTYTFAISGGNTDQAAYSSRETTNSPSLVITP